MVDILAVKDNNLIRLIDMSISSANLEKINNLYNLKLNYDSDSL